MALGTGVTLVGPDTVLARMKKEIIRLREQYNV